MLARRDVLGIAQTGTGKTAAFVLPMLTMLEQGRARARMPRTLILEPTRELAAQVAEHFEKYGKNHKLNVALIIGGVSFDDQDAKLLRGVDVLIATPGRLLDHSERGRLLLSGVRAADHRRSRPHARHGLHPRHRAHRQAGAVHAPDAVLHRDHAAGNPAHRRHLPAQSGARRSLQARHRRHHHHPVAGRRPAAIRHEKRETLRRLIRSAEDFKNAIVFCNRKREVAQLHRSLVRHKFNAVALHGDLDQSARTAALEAFRNGEAKLLIASDVAARGLDIPAVSHIFNFDVPHHPDDYVHRIGRTGRAGLSGTAITIVAPIDGKSVDAIERLIGQTIPWMGEPAPAEPREAAREAGRMTTQRSRRAAGAAASQGRDRQPEPRRAHRTAAREPAAAPAGNARGAAAPAAAARAGRRVRRQPPARLPAASGLAQSLINAAFS